MTHECKHEADLGKMSAQFDSICDKLDKVIRILDGNGADGLKTIVSKHQDFIAGRRRIEWIIGAAVLGLWVRDLWPNIFP